MIRIRLAQKNDSGFQSSAGLMRYFENEKGVRIGPKVVIAIAIVVIAVVLVLNTIAPL